MQFCLASSKILRTESILLSHVFMACSLAGSNYISVSSVVVSEASHMLSWTGILQTQIYMAIRTSRLIFLFVCFSCLDFRNVLVSVTDNFLILVFQHSVLSGCKSQEDMRRNTAFHALGNAYFRSLGLLSSSSGAVIQLIHPEPFEK